jgi:lysophospholipase L1-like esterase
MSERPDWVQIGIWGDSIIHGGRDTVMGGWVTRLKMYCVSRQLGDHIFNLGLGGNNSTEVLNRIAAEIEARTVHIDHVFVSVGVNDITNKNKLTTPEVYEGNLRGIIGIIRSRNKTPHLLTMAPIQRAMDEWRQYNDIILRTVESLGTGLIDLRDCDLGGHTPDGVHPDADGHEKIFQHVKAQLLAQGIIPAELEA